MKYKALIFSILLCSGLMPGCDDSSFVGSSSKKKKSPEADAPGASDDPDNDTEAGTAPEGGNEVKPGEVINDVGLSPDELKEIAGLSDDERSKNQLLKDFTAEQRQQFYVVTREGHVYYVVLDNKKVNKEASRHWTYKHAGTGSRTYVTEGGLLFTNNGGRFYFVDPLTQPNNSALDQTPGGPNHYVLAGVGENDRSCVVSYLKNGERYAGFGYGSGASAKFAEIKLENTPPYRPIWQVVGQGNATGGWGYSCFIDQNLLVYYGQWARAQGTAFNLRTLTEVDKKASAANGNFSSTTLADATQGVSGTAASYAMAGDRSGNVFNGQNFYTFAPDLVHPIVWATVGSELRIYPKECLTTDTKCEASKVKVINTSTQIGANLGPLSGLVGGGLIGINRNKQPSPNGRQGEAYYIEYDQATGGTQITLLDQEIIGDPYMYTDFTGATLYVEDSNLDFDLKSSGNFDDNQALRLLALTWTAKDASQNKWQDIKLEVRCYNEGTSPPQFSEVTEVKDAGLYTFLLTGSCRYTDVNHAEVRLTQLNDKKTVANVKEIKLTFFQ